MTSVFVLVVCLAIVGVNSWDLTLVNGAIKACAKDQGVSDGAADKLVEVVAKYVNDFKPGDDEKVLQDNVKNDSELILRDDGQEGKFQDLGQCITGKVAVTKVRR